MEVNLRKKFLRESGTIGAILFLFIWFDMFDSFIEYLLFSIIYCFLVVLGLIKLKKRENAKALIKTGNLIVGKYCFTKQHTTGHDNKNYYLIVCSYHDELKKETVFYESNLLTIDPDLYIRMQKLNTFNIYLDNNSKNYYLDISPINHYYENKIYIDKDIEIYRNNELNKPLLANNSDDKKLISKPKKPTAIYNATYLIIIITILMTLVIIISTIYELLSITFLVLIIIFFLIARINTYKKEQKKFNKHIKNSDILLLKSEVKNIQYNLFDFICYDNSACYKAQVNANKLKYNFNEDNLYYNVYVNNESKEYYIDIDNPIIKD